MNFMFSSFAHISLEPVKEEEVKLLIQSHKRPIEKVNLLKDTEETINSLYSCVFSEIVFSRIFTKMFIKNPY